MVTSREFLMDNMLMIGDKIKRFKMFPDLQVGDRVENMKAPKLKQ